MKNVSKKARMASVDEVYILVNGRITHKSRFALFHPEGIVAYQFRFVATSKNIALFNRYLESTSSCGKPFSLLLKIVIKGLEQILLKLQRS